MFCKNCGSNIDGDANFCKNCGQRVYRPYTAYTAYTTAAPPAERISTLYVWLLAAVPIPVAWLVELVTGSVALAGSVAAFLNGWFYKRDEKMLRRAGIDTGSWIWLAIFIVPAYLFVRSSKVDKNYAYSLVWCGIFLLEGAVWLSIAFWSVVLGV